jgi:hypothetical protein
MNGINPGDILLFSQPVTIFGKLVCWWTGSMYSHVAVYLGDNQVYESLEGIGAHLCQLDWYITDAWMRGYEIDWFVLKDGYINRENLVAWFKAHLGIKYPTAWQIWWDYVCMIPQNPNGRYDCAQDVAAGFKYAGYLDKIPVVLETPEHVSTFQCLEYRERLT